MPLFEYACQHCGHEFEALGRAATVPAGPTLDALHELRFVLRATGECQLYQAVSEGAEGTSGASAGAPALAAAWGALSLTLNTADAGTYGGADWLTALVLAGERTLLECRRLA